MTTLKLFSKVAKEELYGGNDEVLCGLHFRHIRASPALLVLEKTPQSVSRGIENKSCY